MRDDAGAAAEARARQRGRERRAYYGTGGGLSEDQLLARALEASRAENYAPHVQGPSPLDAAGEDEAPGAGGVAPVARARAAGPRAAAQGRERPADVLLVLLLRAAAAAAAARAAAVHSGGSSDPPRPRSSRRLWRTTCRRSARA